MDAIAAPPTSDTVKTAEPGTRFMLTMMVWLKPAGAGRMAAFRQQAAPLFAKYDLRVERQLAISGKGQLVGENRFEQPDLVQVVSFPSPDAFKAYVGDPLYAELAAQRDEGVRRMTVFAGVPHDIEAVRTDGTGAEHTRLYGVGLVRFLPDGASGMDAFNMQAQGLFARHGMHLESSINVGQIMTPIGEAPGMNPHRVVVFFLDDPAALKAYVADPEYTKLAPLRDDGLERYDLFFGMAAPNRAQSEAGEQ